MNIFLQTIWILKYNPCVEKKTWKMQGTSTAPNIVHNFSNLVLRNFFYFLWMKRSQNQEYIFFNKSVNYTATNIQYDSIIQNIMVIPFYDAKGLTIALTTISIFYKACLYNCTWIFQIIMKVAPLALHMYFKTTFYL